MKLTKQQTAFLPTVPLELAEVLLSYRLGMRVTEVMVLERLPKSKGHLPGEEVK